MTVDVEKLREVFKDPFDLVTTSDGIKLFLRKWEPSKPSNTAILILHGITAYSGPYEMFGNPLSQAGFTVIGLDLRGHGLSDGRRGDYPSKERLINDLIETIAHLKKQFKTLIVLGHSLGVLNAIIAAKNSIEKIDGLILLSAGKIARPGVYKKRSFFEKLKILFSSILRPSKPVIRYYREGMIGLDDPLFNFNYTFRFMRLIDLKELDRLDELRCPLIFGIREQDELFSIESAQSLFEDIPCQDKKFIIMSGAMHAKGFTDESFNEIISWLQTKYS